LQAHARSENALLCSAWLSALTTGISSAGVWLTVALARSLATRFAGGDLEVQRNRHASSLKGLNGDRSPKLPPNGEVPDQFTQQEVRNDPSVAMVTQQIDSALAAIRETAALLQSGEIDGTNAGSSILTEADFLSALMSDVQVVRRLVHADFPANLRPTALESLLESAVSFAARLPGHHPAHREGSADQTVLAEPARITQVMRNLLTIAAECSPPGSPLIIRTIPTAERIRIEVQGQGAGIEPEDAANILEKINRGLVGDPADRSGRELELQISKVLVQAHGSDLCARSTPGGGWSFAFDLGVAAKVSRNAAEPQRGIRVLLVHDHAVFREALAAYLQREPRIGAVGQAATVRGALERLAGTDVAVIDLVLPDGDGLDILRAARASKCVVSFLVLTGNTAVARYAEAFEEGAAGVVSKSASLDAIVDSICRLHRGETVTSVPEMEQVLRFARLQREREHEVRAAMQQLTPREKDVLQAITDGLADREIAVRLTLSVQTVRTHTIRIFNKLGVHSRLQAALLAVRYDIVRQA
jgi:two-component system, NarL family, nitrate/nitrite response regulator NarL